MKKSKRNLLLSIISLVLVSSVLVLTTFEHTQSGFSVLGKSFFSGTRSGDSSFELYWTDDLDNAQWKNIEETGNEILFGSDIRWEPDVPVVRYFKVKNAGSQAFEYDLGIVHPDPEILPSAYVSDHQICNVIDVCIGKVDNIDTFNINTLLSDDEAYNNTLSGCFESGGLIDDEGHRPSLSGNGSDVYAFAFQMNHDADNRYQGNGPLGSSGAGFKIYVQPYSSENGPDTTGLHIKLPQDDDYEFLYRVGNYDNVPVNKLFEKSENSSKGIGTLFAVTASAESFDKSKLNFICAPVNNNFNVRITEFNKDSGTTLAEVLSGGKLKFTGTGVIKLTMVYNGEPVLLDNDTHDPAEIYLEVVNAKNCTTANSLPKASDTTNGVLLNDISITGSYTLPSGKTLYGNGFTIADGRTSSQTTNGYFTIGDGTVDNVIFNGQVYSKTVIYWDGGSDCFAPGVVINGDANIYNCHISECRYAVKIDHGNVFIKNSTITGGTNANISINGGNVTLENCVTASSVRGGKRNLGVMVAVKDCSLTLNGTFAQYNWLRKTDTDIPSPYSSVVGKFYDYNNFVFTYNTEKYINMGIIFVNESTDDNKMTLAAAQGVLTDNTSNSYSFQQVSYSSYAGTIYTAAGSTGSADMLTYPGYSAANNGQYNTIPGYSFDFTNKNYIAREDGNSLYCYRDDATGKVIISFNKEDDSSHFDWDPKILTVSKYGLAINPTITMGGNDYTNADHISFTESGDYQVIYTYTDSNQYFYSKDIGIHQPAEAPSYTHIVNIKVIADNVKYADFSYIGDWENSAKKVFCDGKVYVMPDVSATNTYIGSTTVAGKTVYYPIVTVNASGSTGNGSYSSGKIYYFAPVFNALNIIDYNQETRVKQYEYNKNTTTWPHGQSATSGPDTAYFSSSSEKTWGPNSPYARNTDAKYYKYNKNNNGVCYTTNEIEKNNDACEHLVQYHYVSNDGTTYYYYIYYKFGAATYDGSGCIAEGTLITLADGTKKPIEDITFQDKLLSYNLFTGCNEVKRTDLLINHGKDFYNVLNLKFKDGTVLRFITDHGIFDYTLNKFVYLSEYDYKDYIGHKFVKLKENGKFKKVKLVDAFVTSEYTTAFTISSAHNSTAFAQDMLTLTPPADYYNWIETSGKIRYDKKQFDADVEKYGLYDYSLFKDYISYETFDAFNIAYAKIAVEKGKFTFDRIIELLEMYGSYMK